MITKRHNHKLYWKDKRISASRIFEMNGNTYFVHIIDYYCTKVMIFSLINEYKDGLRVALRSIYNLYSNTKGLYFNFPCLINDLKKIIRIYIGE